MDKKYINLNEPLFIVSLDNGIRCEEPVTIDIINSFSDSSHLVKLNNTIFGVLKLNNDIKSPYIDDLDIIKSDIAELLDIRHEEVRRIVTEDKGIGSFTLLNYSKDIETRISATTIVNNIIKYINQGLITGNDVTWFSKTLNYQTNSKTSLKDVTEIEDVIKLGIYSLEKEAEFQIGAPLGEKTKRAIEKYYIRMILFDLLIGRKYRGFDYYIISKINNEGKPIWSDAYLSPISVSNNANLDNTVKDTDYVLNNKILDRNALIQVLFDKFYREIRKLTEALNDAKKLYINAISRIIYNNIDLSKAGELEEQILNNLNRLTKAQKDHENKLGKEEKTNKVERTMATQSLNVRVTAKLDLIQKRYPINPKDHPELKNKKNIKNEDIKLIVEEDNKGFTATPIIIALISLIVGIGIGISYVLITFGN